jgi:hypothetical protein
MSTKILELNFTHE